MKIKTTVFEPSFTNSLLLLPLSAMVTFGFSLIEFNKRQRDVVLLNFHKIDAAAVAAGRYKISSQANSPEKKRSAATLAATLPCVLLGLAFISKPYSDTRTDRDRHEYRPRA